MLQKVQKQGIRFWHVRTLKVLVRDKFNPYFWQTYLNNQQSLVFSHAKILFLISLLFGALRLIPTHYLNFKF